MYNLLAFLNRYKFFFLFLILETISIGLVVSSYSYQRSLVMNTVNDLTGNIFETYSEFSDFIYLKEVNRQLVQENAMLRNKIKSSFFTQDYTDTTFVSKDTLYRYIPAHIVYMTLHKPANYIVVNKGEKQGVKKEMGVISPTGIVGIVIGVSKNYSLIMPVLHYNFKISSRIKKYGMLVSVIWEKGDYRFGKIIDIPSHLELQKGDTLVTTGFSTIFPENIPVGYVEDYVFNPDKEFSEGTIKFATDFKTLQDVYIIESVKKPEIEELLNNKDE